MKNLNIAVDIGGTFTDLLAFDTDTGRIHQAKCLSTPPEFAKGVLDGIRKAELDLTTVESFVHGSTVAINTALERTGAKTALRGPMTTSASPRRILVHARRRSASACAEWSTATREKRARKRRTVCGVSAISGTSTMACRPVRNVSPIARR